MTDLKARWIRPSDLEKILGISRSRQARLRCDGKLEYHKLNSFVYYDANYINQLIENGKVA